MAFCINHPNKETRFRCENCRKSICTTCARMHDGKFFCSSKCASTYLVSQTDKFNIPSIDSERKRKRVIWIAVIAALVLLVLVVLLVSLTPRAATESFETGSKNKNAVD